MKGVSKISLSGKRVLLRADLNVPVKGKKVLDDTRITRLLPTINFLKSKDAKIILISHFGRPEGKVSPEFSMRFLKDVVENSLSTITSFCPSIDKLKESVEKLPDGEILLLENLRFYPGEEKNDDAFARQLASVADIYVNDAFACSHRAHASIVAITKFLPSYPGLLLEEEVINLEKSVDKAKKPSVAIVGGKKVSSKFPILYHLSQKVENLVIGGAMANTFLMAQGHSIGKSYCELDILEEVTKFIKTCTCKILLPVDAVVAKYADGSFVEARSCEF
jgi:phosphoglycerate kinase